MRGRCYNSNENYCKVLSGVVLFIFLYNVVFTFKFVEQTLMPTEGEISGEREPSLHFFPPWRPTPDRACSQAVYGVILQIWIDVLPSIMWAVFISYFSTG